MTPSNGQQKPTTGILMYGKKVIAENKPFRELTHLQTTLIQQGYDKQYFHKHYYRG
jgi:hypothetical protein